MCFWIFSVPDVLRLRLARTMARGWRTGLVVLSRYRTSTSTRTIDHHGYAAQVTRRVRALASASFCGRY